VALQLKELGFKDVHCLKGGYREWVKAQWPVENKGTEPKKECVTCHMDVTPAIVEDWKLSRHAKQEVTCAVCHGDHHTSAIDTEQTMPVHPDRCGMCHQTQSEQFKKGKHARAWDVMKALPSAQATMSTASGSLFQMASMRSRARGTSAAVGLTST